MESLALAVLVVQPERLAGYGTGRDLHVATTVTPSHGGTGQWLPLVAA